MTSPAAPIGLTAGQVCRELGLVPATLRAWNRRYGIGPSAHQPGKHRYYEPADVAALARMQSLIADGTPAAVAAGIVTRAAGGLPEGKVPRTARGLRTAVLRMDSVAVAAALRDGLQRGGPLELWHRLYRPVMAHIGAEVSEHGRCLEAERLLSWAASAALHQVPPSAAAAPRSVILACVEGEHHSLGLEVVRAVLAEQDVPVTMLGADTARLGLRAAVSAAPRPIVVLSAQTAGTARVARVSDLLDHAEVLVAGPGWSRVRLPADVVPVTTVEAAVEQVGLALRDAG